MAKDKVAKNVRVLGTVVKVYDSGICETDKGFSVHGKFAIGTALEQDPKSKIVKEREKIPTGAKGNNNSQDSQNEERKEDGLFDKGDNSESEEGDE